MKAIFLSKVLCFQVKEKNHKENHYRNEKYVKMIFFTYLFVKTEIKDSLTFMKLSNKLKLSNTNVISIEKKSKEKKVVTLKTEGTTRKKEFGLTVKCSESTVNHKILHVRFSYDQRLRRIRS